MSYILALDQGTTSCRAIVFDEHAVIHGLAQKEFQQIYPRPGWVEHDPEEIWSAQIEVARAALARAGLTARDMAVLGITNQRETTMLWERNSGRPLHNAIVWQDRRTASACAELKARGCSGLIQRKTGLVIDAYFSGTKLQWLLNEIPGARQRAARGELACGTIDTWLLWKLTGGELHATDATNASRTMLYNIQQGAWDPELLDLLDIPQELLPQVRSSSEIYGETAPDLLGGSIPIGGVAGDQQAALFGQGCFDRGLAKNTYGTGCFLLMNIGSQPLVSRHQLLTTIAWKLPHSVEYALEGSVFVAGAVVQWLRDGLGLIRSSDEIEALAGSVADSGGVYFVPALTGLGAPHWDPYARGTIVGLTRGSTAGHLARAAIEAIAFQVADVLDAMRQDSGIVPGELRVDGGAAKNNLLAQFQADILQLPVIRRTTVETTAFGAASLAGLAAGIWPAREDLRHVLKTERAFQPRMSADEADQRRTRWQEALSRAKGWERSSEQG